MTKPIVARSRRSGPVLVCKKCLKRSPAGDTDLQTTRMSGDVRFTLVMFETDEETDVAHLLEHARVAIDPAQAPAPVQRVGLMNPRILHDAVR